MAEFKLGRIRFVWKDAWASGTQYYRDDVIRFGGRLYICVIGHTAQSDFFADLDISPSKWNLVSDGQNWKGEWATETYYVYNDIVKYGARLYICNTVHTSDASVANGLEADQSKWDIFGEGLDFKGDWTVSTRYRINDLVKYGGLSYVCNTVHNSASTASLGLETDQEKWDEFNLGIDYKSDWITGTRYKKNDIIKYGGSLYICNTYHTAGATFEGDSANWEEFVEGVQFENAWTPTRAYQKGDIVVYGGYQYIAKQANQAANPYSSTVNWSVFSKGFNFRGDWGDDSSSVDYRTGDVVRVNGYTYYATKDNSGFEPGETLNWAEYWERLNGGFFWRGTWLDDQEYKKGDVVRYGDNSYVCVDSHISEGDDYSTETAAGDGGGAENSRPDLDTAGTYWNILVIGSETSVLTTVGDLVYYGGAGPTRLPVGREGQVLRVSNTSIPEWTYLGASTDTYYVGESGTDSPAPTNGLTVDKPFKTIRYACEQVDKGASNPDAAYLLETNRLFIQREIVEWTEAQITGNIAPFTSAFSYDTKKCERDMGYIIDAAIWDLTHGGNVKSREAALKYVQEPGKFYTLGQEEETVASINYGLTVMQSVLNNTAPAVNYQLTNGDNSTAVITQITDTSKKAEANVYTTITGLVKIVTDAITAGNADDIPARLIRNVLIRVATGEYLEHLPIIVPAETCIMGDELRSTTTKARTKYNSADTLTPRGDVRYSVTGLERMEEIIGDIVRGVEVTPSTGNTESQSRDFPFGELQQELAAEKLARIIRRRIDHGVGEKLEADLPKTLDDTRAQSSDYSTAIQSIRENKQFAVEEVTAFITTNYPNLKYSKTKCRQDTGYIIDAILYDLTFGGNWQSVNAGLAYYDGREGTLQIDSTEKTATIASYNRLKFILQAVTTNTLVTPALNTEQTQVRMTAATSTQSNAVGTLIDKITDIINLGTSQATITYPDYTGASDDLIKSSERLIELKQTIGEETIDFISKNFGTFKYNSAVCRRDLRNILTDVAYDAALGTNYNGVYQGIAYTRPINAYNIQNQRAETVGAINYAKGLAGESLTSDGSSAVGSSTAKTRSDTAFSQIIDGINDGGVGTAQPGDGVFAAITLPTPTGADQNRVDAKDNLQANRDFIAADVVAYVNNNTPPAGYDQDKCSRDVQYIVDALSYDILYQGTQAITRITESYFGIFGAIYPEGQVTETVNAYTHMASIIEDIVQENDVTAQSGNLESQVKPGTPASATEATELTNKVTILTNALTAGNLDSVPTAVYPDITWASAEIESAKSSLDSDRENIIVDTIQYINTTYSGFVYDQAKCQRDLGLIIDAARFDFMLGTNFASMVAAYSYLREPSQKVTGYQKDATLAANEFARLKAVEAMNGNAAAIAGINTTWSLVDDTIFGGTPQGGNAATDRYNTYAAIHQLEQNKEFMVGELKSYVDEYYKDTVTATDAASDSLTVTSTAWLKPNMAIKFSGTVLDVIVADTVYYVKDILSSTTFTLQAALNGTTINLGSDTGSMTVQTTYEYNRDLCSRDVRAYVDALKWDLKYPQEWKREYTDGVTVYYPGYYKSSLAARYYVNSVLGSQEEDMYYLRNNTGLRLQTLDGLNGDLTPANSYGTSRVTAGAYASLDPGWGPDDERAWITARSPYVQNLTTFGYAATGQKIDGALHNGGNDSIVSNDFTQVISDGIGAHILNNGRAELVSVFTYYSHIGYLAETGGRVRATNGNNSYGTFGSVAEGVDPDETPVTAIVDNSGLYNAAVASVPVTGEEVLGFEYSHAGNEYTEAVINVFGSGSGAEVEVDEFRDNAVFQVRILDLNDSAGDFGGLGYKAAENTAQAGTTSSISLAATDGEIATAYPGMRVYVTGGAGVGQHALIHTYNSGSKLATVLRETLTVDTAGSFDTTTYRIDTLGTTDFTAIGAANNEVGLIFTATGAGTGTGTATKLESGWDHIIPGETIAAPNSSSTYRIEPAIAFTEPDRTTTGGTRSSSLTATGATFGETAKIYTGQTGSPSGSGEGATFDVTRTGSKYFVSLTSGGTGYERLETITIDGSLLGGTTITNDLVITASSINTATGQLIDFDFEGFGTEGIFVVAQDNSNQINTSKDGATWSNVTLTGGASFTTDVAVGYAQLDDGSSVYEPSRFVVVGGAGTADQAYYSDDGVTWEVATLQGGPYTGNPSITFDGVNFILIFDNSQSVLKSGDGISWTEIPGALPATGAKGIKYGKGKVVLMGGTAADTAYYSTDGASTWSTASVGSSTVNFDTVAYGKNRFIAREVASTGEAYSFDGVTWTSNNYASGNWGKVAYGQGIFVCPQTDNTGLRYSEDGITWYTDLTAANGSATNIVFGNPNRQGKFISIATGAANTTDISEIGCRARGRPDVADERIFQFKLSEPGSNYSTAPDIIITDPNNINDVVPVVRIGTGALATPSFINRGDGYQSASADLSASESNGKADFFQTGRFIAVKRLSDRPVNGSNVVFDSLPGQTFKLVNTVTFLGDNPGSYTAFLNISPEMLDDQAPPDGDPVTLRIRYSQVRLTGHDFLDIGTGNFVDTNYPGTPVNDPVPANETVDADGGRVFFTATDQDGNFRVGGLFSVEQATGIATLNADAFNIAGLQELSLGEVTLGGNSASITEFSTDPFFTANSDTIVPTQRAIKAYIEAQIGGGGASLIVNTVTAGSIFIGTNVITTVDNSVINIKAKLNFEGTVIGTPIAYNYFLR